MPMILGYSRVSTVEQAADGTTSLQEQERVIRGYAMMKAASAFDLQIYTDAGVSGSIPMAERPAGGELLSTVKRYDTVVASKLDRMFRNSLDALTVYTDFKKRGIHLVLFDFGVEPVTSDSGIAKVLFHVMSAFADFDRERIYERMVEGKKAKKANGGHAGGEAPYGYRIVGERRSARLEPVAQEQAILACIARAKQHIAENDIRPWRQRKFVLGRLRQENLKTRSGRWFTAEQVQRLMDRTNSAVH